MASNSGQNNNAELGSQAAQVRALRCQSCAAALMNERVTYAFQQAIIRCQYCGNRNQFNFAQDDINTVDKKRSILNQPIIKLRPRNISIEEKEGSIAIKYRWRGGLQSSIFSMLMPIIWLVVALTMTTRSLFDNDLEGADRLPLIFFMLIFLFIGIHIVYRNLQNILNHSTIDMTKNLLTIRHQPLPSYGSSLSKWPPKTEYKVDDIQQFVKMSVGKTSRQAQVFVISKTGKRQPLFKKVLLTEEANFIIERMNKVLL